MYAVYNRHEKENARCDQKEKLCHIQVKIRNESAIQAKSKNDVVSKYKSTK